MQGLKEARKFYGLSQIELSRLAGIPQPILSRAEQQICRLSPHNELKIREVFAKVAVNDLKEVRGKIMGYKTDDLMVQLRAASSREQAVKAIKEANPLQKMGVMSTFEHHFREHVVRDGRIEFTDEETWRPEKLSAGEIIDMLEKTDLLDY